MNKRLLNIYNKCKPVFRVDYIKKLSSKQNDELTSLKKIEPSEEKLLQKYLKKIKFRGKEESKEEERKGPFKNYFEDEERDKKSIMFYEDFFDKNSKLKDRENFMNAIEVFKITNPTKQLYIDFIYGALLKMKEFNAHTHLEAYRKLMEIFPIGPLRCVTKWQRDNMHFPRHQNCAIQILEQMERNGVILDEDFVRLAIKIFGDWTHVVRKAKRQLYWLPKFKNTNPYPLPSIEKFESMKDIELAVVALERMCMSVDNEIKIKVNFTSDLKSENEENNENTWIVTAQSKKQIELLEEHKKSVPIYVDGPYFTWVRSKMVEYFLMRTDPLSETFEKLKKIQEFEEDDDNFKNLYNVFDDPFNNKKKTNKKPELSVYELPEGTIYAICCTGTGTTTSLYSWTKLLENNMEKLKNCIIVYRNKPKTNSLVDTDKLKSEEKKT